MRSLALILCFLSGSFRAFGWGGEGHSLVARLAAAHLTAKAAARVREILGPDVTLATIATWADEVRSVRRETGPWHYVDIPITQQHLDLTRDCPNDTCVVAKIEEFEK